MAEERAIRWFEELTNEDVPLVGGKNASLGEMIQRLKEAGIRVPDGFATTAEAYRRFLAENELEEPIREALERHQRGERSLEQAGKEVRELIAGGRFPEDVAEAIRAAYAELGERYGREDVDVAARSSATAEDLPEASFAGQQESFLNVVGADDLLEACRRCYASLFTDRAISYREQHGFDHLQVALSVGVQKMVRSDVASAGVMFTIDTETGFPDLVVIDASWGLGEAVVGGTVEPDEYRVFKPMLGDGEDGEGFAPIVTKERGGKETKFVYVRDAKQRGIEQVETSADERRRYALTDEEVLQLARWAVSIEQHYGCPMDVEWAKDGERDELYIVQARPETVEARKQAGALKTYTLKGKGEVLVEGTAIGGAIASGPVYVLHDLKAADRFDEGGILVTEMTDPDWVPLMRKAAAVVTDHGGRTSHAAIVSRELGLPAVIGTGGATEALADAGEVTVSCAEGERGHVYAGALEFEERELDLNAVPETETEVMLNLADPDGAFRWWKLPADGVGLARMEFLVNNVLQVHPMALLRPDRLDDETRRRIEDLIAGYPDGPTYFVENMARGMAKIAATLYPKPVIVRFSDFKTNEYAELIGGRPFEPEEHNPMLGFRGASRYTHERYRDAFGLECQAMKRAREVLGLDNLIAMIPFCRTLAEADGVLEAMAENGLRRGEGGFQVYVMAEIPSNVILAREFAERFDGFSIGSNDLTQLVLGVDRDSDILAPLFDENDEAVRRMIRTLISEAHACGTKVGLCGQKPSDDPGFAEFLVDCGIDSISVDPSSLVDVKERVAKSEQRTGTSGRPRRTRFKRAGSREGAPDRVSGSGR